MSGKSLQRVILADDHNVVRRGLAALLTMDGRFTVVAEASNGEELLPLVEQYQPDAIILDLAMPRLNGLETLRRLKRLENPPALIVLSMYDDEELVVQALSNGANGYILKDSMETELFEALQRVQQGECYLSETLEKSILERAPAEPAIDLTTREYEVLQLIGAGYTAVEIADRMCISPHTANRHRANIMQKMGVHNQVELVRLAIKRNLIILGNRPPIDQ